MDDVQEYGSSAQACMLASKVTWHQAGCKGLQLTWKKVDLPGRVVGRWTHHCWIILADAYWCFRVRGSCSIELWLTTFSSIAGCKGRGWSLAPSQVAQAT